ncbi:hypothetical protein MAR_012842 [Mya arenaria]|uniref:Shieldin complex subunit 2 first OB fold domain-containing protein n=1 Tax=Mya arenaria TaxID=6604 RepID=A0ABY7FY57_MYAAR|nr:hypothetical protein MAR_006542 [Mya arenaria]WAR27138.1 hypothetical protein MAR_012842 [Mya arenaria]
MPHQRCRCYFSLQDSVATTVMVNDKEVNVRTITVEDRTGKVKVSLWRNIAAEPVVLGDVVAITNIVVNSKRYNNEESLSSTQFTKIEFRDVYFSYTGAFIVLPVISFHHQELPNLLALDLGGVESSLVTEQDGIFTKSNEDLVIT